jgi:2-haloalkanoic acid dehalogenase type II
MSKEVWRTRGRDPEHPTAGPEPQFGTYVDLWTEQFDLAFRELGLSGDPRAAYDLIVERVRTAPPYPEVRGVLDALRPLYRVCVLSNADDDWLHPCLSAADLRFEHIVSSESARSYKPRAKIFHDTAALLGVPPAGLLYVGDSPIADVLGARAAGLPVAWVNRHDAKLPEKVPVPDLEVTDLRGLLPYLLDGSARRD